MIWPRRSRVVLISARVRRGFGVERQHREPSGEPLHLAAVLHWFGRFSRAMQQFGQHYCRDTQPLRFGTEARSQPLGTVAQDPYAEVRVEHVAQHRLERLARLGLRLLALSKFDAGRVEEVTPEGVRRHDHAPRPVSEDRDLAHTLREGHNPWAGAPLASG